MNPEWRLAQQSMGELIVWWQWLQSRQRLSRSVLPPCSQWTMWWAWHQLAEAPQPTQPLSRAASTARWRLLAWRFPRPSQSGSRLRLKMAGRMLASQASLRSSSEVSGVPSARRPRRGLLYGFGDHLGLLRSDRTITQRVGYAWCAAKPLGQLHILLSPTA